MKKPLLVLAGLLLSITTVNSQQPNEINNQVLQSGRDLIGTSAHFNFYADTSLAHYWDSIQTPLEDQFTMFSGLLDFGGGVDSLFTSITSIDVILYNSHQELDDEYSYDLYDWKCGVFSWSPKSISLCIPQTQLQTDFYPNFSTLAVNLFSQLAIKLNILRRGQSYYPEYFREGVGLYYSGFDPDPETLDNYVVSLGHTPTIADLEDITNIATSGLKDLIVSNIQFQAISSITTRYMDHAYHEDKWQEFIPLFYQNTEPERMKLQLSTDNFDLYCIDKDVQYINDMANSLEDQCADNQSDYEMTFNHRFSISILPYTETWDDLTHWGPQDGASAYGNENIFISSFDYCYENNYNNYLNSLIPHEYGHVTHAHMYWEIPMGFYAEGMASFIPGEPLDPNTNNDEWRIDQVFNNYLNTYGRLPTFEEFVENPNFDIDPYFFGYAFCSFIHDYYGGRLALKGFFNSGMDFASLNTTEDSGYYYYIKYLEYVRDWIPDCPDANFEADLTTGIETLEVQFTDLSEEGINPITEWYWEFGDGTTSTDQNPIHTYNQPGSYTVYMTASDGSIYDFDLKTNYIEVNYLTPTANFEGTPLTGEAPLLVTFNDLSLDSVNTWLWEFGDGDTSIVQYPLHEYKTPGNYTVSLTVTGPGGSHTEHKTDYVLITVDIKELKSENIHVFPNPTSNKLMIIFPDAKKRLLILNDLTGKQILRNTVFGSEEIIDMQRFQNGVYYLKISSGKSIAILKIINQ